MRAGAFLLSAVLLSGCIPSIDVPDEPYRAPPQPARSQPVRSQQAQSQPARSQPAPYRQADVPNDYQRRRGDEEVSALPAPRPAWEARPVEADARTITGSIYVVQSGDTLRGIADRTGASTEAIGRANAIDPPYAIRAGQRLAIPAGRYHLVRRGETGIAIARAYGVPWSRIVTENALVEPYVLRAGQRVLIPGTADGAPVSLADRAAAFSLDVDDILTGGEPALASREAPAKPIATPKRVLPSTAVVTAPPRLTSGAFVWPVDGEVVRRFGPGRSGERNDGIKIAVPVSTPIHAAADGVVAYVGDGIAALGGLVIIKHGGGWTSVYGHASKLLVQRGQSVKKGQTIALSGDTGFADRPEVHFELRKGRTPVDPQTQLPRT